MDLALPAVLVAGLIIGTLTALFARPTPRAGQVFLWTISGSILGGYAGAVGSVVLLLLLLPPGGAAFSGLVLLLFAWAIGGLVGAIFGGSLALALLERNSPQLRRLLSFMLLVILTTVAVGMANRFYQDYRSARSEAEIKSQLQPKVAQLVNTFTPATEPGGIHHHLAVSDDSQVLASTSGEEISVWDIPSGQKLRSLPGNGSQITALALSSTGQTLAAGVVSDTVVVYDVATGQQKYVFSYSNPSQHVEITSLAISPNGQRMVSAGRDSAVRLWDLSTGKLIETLIEPSDGTIQHSVTFSPSNQTVLAVSPNLVKIWRQSDGQPLRTLGIEPSSASSVASIAISGDGQTLMIARSGYCSSNTEHNLLEFWDLKTGLRKQSINPECFPIPPIDISRSLISAADMSHDGQVVVTKDLNNVAQVWKVNTGEVIDTFSDGHPSGVPAVAISADGRTIFSAGTYEGHVQLWQLPVWAG